MFLKFQKFAIALPNCLQAGSEHCFPKSGNSILKLNQHLH